MTAFDALRALPELTLMIPEADERDLLPVLRCAEGMIRGYTCRSEGLPETLSGAVVLLAAILYNRRGMEGESAHSEGSVSRTVEPFPEMVRALIEPYRLARPMA